MPWFFLHFAAGFCLAITDRLIANHQILNTKYVSTVTKTRMNEAKEQVALAAMDSRLVRA